MIETWTGFDELNDGVEMNCATLCSLLETRFARYSFITNTETQNTRHCVPSRQAPDMLKDRKILRWWEWKRQRVRLLKLADAALWHSLSSWYAQPATLLTCTEKMPGSYPYHDTDFPGFPHRSFLPIARIMPWNRSRLLLSISFSK
jgi:hypothetical protein